jgi:DNA mismatch endonuclease (patch repair protein)
MSRLAGTSKIQSDLVVAHPFLSSPLRAVTNEWVLVKNRMADVFSKRKRSQVMAAVRGKANKSTELRLLRMFRENRIKGWRRHWPVAGLPDFVFLDKHLALFVDGCFWHGCPTHLRTPKSNNSYWRYKISTNRSRDREVRRTLKQLGWRVLRIWEHELRNEQRCLSRIRLALELRD